MLQCQAPARLGPVALGVNLSSSSAIHMKITSTAALPEDPVIGFDIPQQQIKPSWQAQQFVTGTCQLIFMFLCDNSLQSISRRPGYPSMRSTPDQHSTGAQRVSDLWMLLCRQYGGKCDLAEQVSSLSA